MAATYFEASMWTVFSLRYVGNQAILPKPGRTEYCAGGTAVDKVLLDEVILWEPLKAY